MKVRWEQMWQIMTSTETYAAAPEKREAKLKTSNFSVER